MNCYIPDDPTIDTYGQDAGYCDECGEHLDGGRCECPESPCEVCGVRESTPSGACTHCEIEWAATHQLGYTPPELRAAGTVEQGRRPMFKAFPKPVACRLCGAPTHGSTGAAGIRWASICQPCKDAEDGALRASLAAMGMAHAALFNRNGGQR